MASLDWTEKYRPQTLSQVIGHPRAVAELMQWAKSWNLGIPKDRAVVIYGRAGIGKTTVAHALAHDMGWEVIELNASDQRTADIIEKIVGSASQMSTLEGGGMKRLVIMDEADNIHGTADRGGERAIVELIKKTSQPIILIANELYDMSAGLRSACKPIEFRAVKWQSMIPVLKKVVEAEGVTCWHDVLEMLAKNANGDLRSAINDLQGIAQGKSKVELNDIVTGKRDTKETIFRVLEKIFKGTNINEAYKATFNLDENPEDFIQWVDENLHLESRKYLFSWDNIPGEDTNKLLNFLKDDLNIKQVDKAKIIKKNEDRTIFVSIEDKSIEITLDENKEEVILKNIDGRIYNLPVKREKGDKKKVKEKDKFKIYFTNGKDLEKGYFYLSKASVYLGRVTRRQNYNMWRYANIMMTAGIVVSRSNRYSEFVNYQPPSLWRKLGQTKGTRQVRDSIAKKIGTYCHVSMSYTRSQLLPFFRRALKNDEYAPSVTALLGLEPEEIAFLVEAKSVTKKIQKIYDEAQSMIEKETEQDIELFGGFGAKNPGEAEELRDDEPEVEVRKEIKSQSSLFDF